MHMKYFLIDEERQTVVSLLLPRINTASPIPKIVKTDEENLLGRKVKTPILMASSEGEEEGNICFTFSYFIFNSFKEVGCPWFSRAMLCLGCFKPGIAF